MSDEITKAYASAAKRLFLLDYDGTLADIKPTPPEAKPTPEILRILKKLSDNAHNKIVIVSGREHSNLDDWLGGLPLDISAEHGLFIRERGQPWQQMHNADASWKNEVKPLLQSFVRQAPGSFIEEKTYNLGWHYRGVEAGLTAKFAPQLLQKLRDLAPRHDLDVLDGNKVIEIKPGKFNKGTVAHHWLRADRWDFILAAGDDATDEHLLAAVPSSAYTIKIGSGPSEAKLRLASPQELRSLLASFL